jgi:hypothetical protein
LQRLAAVMENDFSSSSSYPAPAVLFMETD